MDINKDENTVRVYMRPDEIMPLDVSMQQYGWRWSHNEARDCLLMYYNRSLQKLISIVIPKETPGMAEFSLVYRENPGDWENFRVAITFGLDDQGDWKALEISCSILFRHYFFPHDCSRHPHYWNEDDRDERFLLALGKMDRFNGKNIDNGKHIDNIEELKTKYLKWYIRYFEGLSGYYLEAPDRCKPYFVILEKYPDLLKFPETLELYSAMLEKYPDFCEA